MDRIALGDVIAPSGGTLRVNVLSDHQPVTTQKPFGNRLADPRLGFGLFGFSLSTAGLAFSFTIIVGVGREVVATTLVVHPTNDIVHVGAKAAEVTAIALTVGVDEGLLDLVFVDGVVTAARP